MNKHQTLCSAVVVVFLVALSLGQAWCQPPSPEPEVVGWLSGVIPFHKDAIATSLVWRRESMCPKLLMWMRPSEYRPSDYIAPDMFGEGFPGFNPDFATLVMGGFNLGRLDESGWSPYGPDNLRENTQLVDVCGLQALIDTGRFDDVRDIRLLTDDHMSATDPYFRDAGYSRGLAQNIFCAGNSADAKGRIIAVGGHDKGGNNGISKIIIFDPETERWLDRPVPCVRAQWEMDPTGTLFPHCSPLVDHNTDPLSSSDMKYQRWYPTSVLLPDGRLLVLSGTDQDTSDPDTASATKVRIATPEVYDPVTDRNVQLENARRLQPMYPRSFVVQTGREWDDWVVCSVAKVVPPLPSPENISQFDPWRYDGSTACLDVQAALADPDRGSPTEADHYWTEVDRAQSAHDSGAAVFMVDIRSRTKWSQRAFVFGGDTGNGTNSAAAERIDFSQAAPRWERMDDLHVATTQNNAVVLPDGSILVVGGQDSNYIQHYDPDTGRRTTLMSHVAPRYDHSTALVMPNGGVWIMGGNRVDLLPQQEVNRSVPVLEYYKPAYFFFKGPAPVITEADDHMRYGESYEIGLAAEAADIASVVLLRSGPITHNWAWDNRYVRLPFDACGRHLQVMAPPLPGLAPPGDYMLFVVGENGRPGEARRIRLG